MMCNLCDESTRAMLIPQINASMCTSVGTHSRVSAWSVQVAALSIHIHTHSHSRIHLEQTLALIQATLQT